MSRLSAGFDFSSVITALNKFLNSVALERIEFNLIYPLAPNFTARSLDYLVVNLVFMADAIL